MNVAPSLKRVPASSRRLGAVGGWAPGVGIGLAIYSTMFMAAGAWRSDEVALAVDSGKATPAGAALHSFQVASVESATRVRIALASATPTARFVEPQRVTLAYAAAPEAALPEIRDAEMPSFAEEFVPAPIRLHAVDAESHPTAFTSQTLAPLELSNSLDAVSVDIEGLRTTL